MPRCELFNCLSAFWIPFGAPQTEKERYREDSHGPCARMTRTNREVYQIFFPRRSVSVFFQIPFALICTCVLLSLPRSLLISVARPKTFHAQRGRVVHFAVRKDHCTPFCAQMCLCLFHHTISILLRSARACFPAQKGVVVHFALTRGHCTSFWFIVPPLQVAPSLACSVASLSHSPGH